MNFDDILKEYGVNPEEDDAPADTSEPEEELPADPAEEILTEPEAEEPADEELPEEEKVYDRNTSIETLKFIVSNGYEIKKKS